MSDSQNRPEDTGSTSVEDSWKLADRYEYFMGRWSRLVARSFLEWLAPQAGMKWLDIGCGSGALSEAIIRRCSPAQLVAVDQSESFALDVQRRLGSKVICQVGDAHSLPLDDASADFAASGLVLNFTANPAKAVAEMKRVIKPGGAAAVYVWDYSGKMDFLNRFWDAVVALDPKSESLHEGTRFPDSNTKALQSHFENAGFADIESAAIEIETNFRDFDDYWMPFLGGQGPAPSYLVSLNESHRNRLQEMVRANLPIQSDGSISLEARAWAVRGRG